MNDRKYTTGEAGAPIQPEDKASPLSPGPSGLIATPYLSLLFACYHNALQILYQPSPSPRQGFPSGKLSKQDPVPPTRQVMLIIGGAPPEMGSPKAASCLAESPLEQRLSHPVAAPGTRPRRASCRQSCLARARICICSHSVLSVYVTNPECKERGIHLTHCLSSRDPLLSRRQSTRDLAIFCKWISR